MSEVYDWMYQGIVYEGPTSMEETVGFVYKITNTSTCKFYIGCKLFYRPHYRMVNKKKKKSFVESSWKDYWSSSDFLNTDVETLGKESFTREILHLVKYKGCLKYVEMKEQILHKCLELPVEECYNSFIGARLHRRSIRF